MDGYQWNELDFLCDNLGNLEVRLYSHVLEVRVTVQDNSAPVLTGENLLPLVQYLYCWVGAGRN